MPEEGKAQLTWCWKWRSGFFSLSWSSILASRSLRSFVPLLSVFPSVSCSFLSFFFSLFLWFWKLVLEQRRRSVGFWFHCPPLYVPFPYFAVLSLVSLFFLSPLCFRLCSLFTSIVFSPSVFSFSVALYLSRQFPLAFSCFSVLLLFFFPSFLPFFPSFSSSCSWLSLSFSVPQNPHVFVCVLASFFPPVLPLFFWFFVPFFSPKIPLCVHGLSLAFIAREQNHFFKP